MNAVVDKAKVTLAHQYAKFAFLYKWLRTFLGYVSVVKVRSGLEWMPSSSLLSVRARDCVISVVNRTYTTKVMLF